MREKEPINNNIPFFLLLKGQCGYSVNESFISTMTGVLKKTPLLNSHILYLQTSEGIQEQIKYVASRGIIDLTCGNKEDNVVNWLHIAHELNIVLPTQFPYESLIEAHESRACHYEEILTEKNPLNEKYYLDEAQKHKNKALYLRRILEKIKLINLKETLKINT